MAYTHPRVGALSPDSLHEYGRMARVAAEALARRTATYPKLVEGGKLTQAEADADLAAWAEIAADWRWIASHGAEGEEITFTLTGLRARTAALDTAIDRFFALIDRQGAQQKRAPAATMSPAQAEQIDALISMRHWAEFEAQPVPAGQVKLDPRITTALTLRLRVQMAGENQERIAA